MAESNASLAAQAHLHYSAAEFPAAVECLQKLQKQMAPAEDARLMHNQALTEYAKTGFANPQNFAHALKDIKAKLRAAKTKEEEGKDGSKGDDDTDGFSGEADTSALLYNMAALHFQNQEYADAARILKSLFSNIEPVEESISMHICFLYLDVLLHIHRGNLHSEKERSQMAQQAFQIVTFLEKPHSFNGQATVPGSSGDDAKGGSNKDAPDIVEFRFRLHLYKAKVLLLQNNMKSAKTEVKSALGIFQKEMKGRDDKASQSAAAGANAPPALLIPPPALQNPAALFLKANLEYLRQNFKKSIKLLYSASASANTSGSSAGSSTNSGFDHQSLLLNNLGCLHYRMQRYRSAAAYFSKALAECDRKAKAPRTPVSANPKTPNLGSIVSTTNECEVLYNSGIQMLLMRKPELAFKCFRKSARLLYERPRLWVRMAEACIMLHAQQCEGVTAKKRALVRDVVGTGSRRRLLLPPSSVALTEQSFKFVAGKKVDAAAAAQEKQQGGGKGGGDTPTLACAVKCLRNALVLCNGTPRGTAAAAASMGAGPGNSFAPVGAASGVGVGSAAGGAKVGGPGAAGAGAGGSGGGGADGGDAPLDPGLAKLRSAIYAKLAFVCLCMHNPVLALSNAEKLLAVKECSGAQRYVGHVYCAEALCLLSRPAEALEHLAPNGIMLPADLAVQAAVANSGVEAGGAAAQPGNLSQQQISAQARSSLHVNLANVHVLQDDLPEAEKCVNQALSICPSSVQALRLQIYLLLRKGKTSEALQVLKERRAVS